MATRTANLRALAQQAASSPQIEQAVLGALRVTLPTVIEGLLCQMYPGETVRLYVRKRPGGDQRSERDRRILAAAASGTPVGLIAAREGLGVRQVQRVIKAGEADQAETPA
jgi:hypothetical protein